MYCYNCGKQISDDVAFCQYCGAKQNCAWDGLSVNQPKALSSSSNSGELDRDALKIYLRNILSLEYAKEKYEGTIRSLRYSIEQHSDNTYIKRYLIAQYGSCNCKYAHFGYNGNLYFLGYRKHSIPWERKDIADDTTWWRIDKDSDLEFLKDVSAFLNDYWYRYCEYNPKGFFTKQKQRESAMNAFFRAYADFKTEAPLMYQSNVRNNREFINNWRKEIASVTKELNAAKKLLKEAYDINIIPSQMRNEIHVIYYLHDFISTSRESFSTALLHFDLDEIKSKLDRIIDQQETTILQNAVMIAQNDKLIAQNQHQLEELSRIESNTNQAAQYAQIAANNAGVCAWFSAANYIGTHR